MWVGIDRRGVSEVLGAILVFAILVSGVAVYQVTVVPQTNEEREVEHSQEVREQFQNLRAAIVTVGSGGGPRSVTIRTSAEYPTRSLTLNPPEPGGTLSTTAVPNAVVLSNLQATDSEAREFWVANSPQFRFDTDRVAFHSEYNYYRDSPTTRYEPTLVYSQFDDGAVVDSQQSLISGRTLNLFLVSGDISESGGVESLDVNPVTTATRTVELEAPAGTDPAITVKTELSRSKWAELLAGNPNVESVSPSGPDAVTITLDDGVTWRMRVRKVSLNEPETTPAAAYMTVEGPTDRTLNPGETTDVTVQVLDKYGSPVEGVPVQRDWGPSRTTGPDGRVTYDYTITTGSVDLNTWFGGSSPGAVSDEKKVAYEFDTSSPSTGSPAASLVNPGTGLVLQDATTASPVSNTAVLTFRNRNSAAGATETISEVRVNFYKVTPPGAVSGGGGTRGDPEDWTSDVTTGTHEVGGSFIATGGTPSVDPGDDATVRVTIEDPDGSFTIQPGDYFVVSVVFADGNSRIYFVDPT